MERTLDMKFIRYLNLFEKITGVRSQHCFNYNLTIVFLVPQQFVSRAIGKNGRNIKKIAEILGRKAKITAIPSGMEDMRKFIIAIVSPVKFKGMEVKDKSVVITAGMQSKAILIGRNKARLAEMKNILNECFGIEELRIV